MRPTFAWPLWMTRAGRAAIVAARSALGEPPYLHRPPATGDDGLPLWLSVEHHPQAHTLSVVIEDANGVELRGVQWYDRLSGRYCATWYDYATRRGGRRIVEAPFTVRWKEAV